jgi:hypothetical protein
VDGRSKAFEELVDRLQQHGSIEAGTAPSKAGGEILPGLAGQIEQPAQLDFRLIEGRLGRIRRVSRDRHLVDHAEQGERAPDGGDDVERFGDEEVEEFPGKTGTRSLTCWAVTPGSVGPTACSWLATLAKLAMV